MDQVSLDHDFINIWDIHIQRLKYYCFVNKFHTYYNNDLSFYIKDDDDNGSAIKDAMFKMLVQHDKLTKGKSYSVKDIS